ncbi:MAG: hypothetical protein HN907_10845 [Nitrospina sp.]|nr:hypothetical protein [Nitrospina sp.]
MSGVQASQQVGRTFHQGRTITATKQLGKKNLRIDLDCRKYFDSSSNSPLRY